MMEGDKIEADLPLIIDNIRAGMGVGLLFPVTLLIVLFIFARQKIINEIFFPQSGKKSENSQRRYRLKEPSGKLAKFFLDEILQETMYNRDTGSAKKKRMREFGEWKEI